MKWKRNGRALKPEQENRTPQEKGGGRKAKWMADLDSQKGILCP